MLVTVNVSSTVASAGLNVVTVLYPLYPSQASTFMTYSESNVLEYNVLLKRSSSHLESAVHSTV